MIKIKGVLKDKNIQELEKANTEGWTVIKIKTIDKIGAFILLLIPLLYGLKRLTSTYHGNTSMLLLFDILGVLLCFIIMIFHELLHAIAFGRKANIEIWFHKFGMITYCIKKLAKSQFLFMLLLPNLLITLPISLMFIINPFLVSELRKKVIALMTLILVMGAYSDLTYIIFIVRNYAKYQQYCVSGDEFYGK